MQFTRVDAIYDYDQLNDEAKENAIFELEADEEYNNFVEEEIEKYNKKLTSDEKWELFDLTTSDELVIAYCTKNGIKFDAYGCIIHDYTNEYKNNPYNAFFK